MTYIWCVRHDWTLHMLDTWCVIRIHELCAPVNSVDYLIDDVMWLYLARIFQYFHRLLDTLRHSFIYLNCFNFCEHVGCSIHGQWWPACTMCNVQCMYNPFVHRVDAYFPIFLCLFVECGRLRCCIAVIVDTLVVIFGDVTPCISIMWLRPSHIPSYTCRV